MTTLFDDDLIPPAGNLHRFGSRWRMVGAGLSDVWRYGDLVLDAPSGRLLLRGPNGTGKTTALEALWPFLLDLNRKMMSAGKARTTTLRSLMRDGATGRRRVGYLWMTLAEPVTGDEHSFGVRVDYSESSAPGLLPFTVPGRPLRELALHGPGRASVTAAVFEQSVHDAGGQTFDEYGYVAHLAARVWATNPEALAELATRLRVLRNPSTLAGLSPREAADVLREALPAVDPKVVTQTGDALAESDTTRAAFARDADAAEALSEFATAWAGHVVDVVGKAHARLVETSARHARISTEIATLQEHWRDNLALVAQLDNDLDVVEGDRASAEQTIAALKSSEAYGHGIELEHRQGAARQARQTAQGALLRATESATRRRKLLTVLHPDLDDLIATLVDLTHQAQGVDPDAQPVPHATVRTTPLSAMLVGSTSVDPGPNLGLEVDDTTTPKIPAHWADRADGFRASAAAAALALIDHAEHVAPLVGESTRTRGTANAAAAALEEARQRTRERTTEANAQVAALLDHVRDWAADPGNSLLLTAQTGHADVEEWSPRLLDEAHVDEPGMAIAQVRAWAATVHHVALAQDAQLRQEATGLREQAAQVTVDAAGLRQEAAELRAGRVLPLPRPTWTTDLASRTGSTVAESTLFGSALAWVDDVPAHIADRVESALVASGLLGAQLGADGLEHPDWVVLPTGPTAPAPTLATILRPDPDHPLAHVAAAVLDRIHLPENTDQTVHPVSIATDATFVLGPLRGHAPGALSGQEPPVASHIGAAHRLAAARARAEVLEAEAGTLDADAAELVTRAAELTGAAKAVIARHRQFPSTDGAYRAETWRATAAEDEATKSQKYRDCETAAARAREALEVATKSWADRTKAAGLPANTDTLVDLERHRRQAATTLDDLAGKLKHTTTRVIPQLRRRLDDIDPTSVTDAITEARARHQDAEGAAATAENLLATVGKAAAEVAQAISHAQEKITELKSRGGKLRADQKLAQHFADQADGKLSELQPAEAELQVACQDAASALVRLLRAPGASAVLVGPAPIDRWWGDDLQGAVAQALTGKKPLGQRGLTDRYDPTRVRIGDAWDLHPGDPIDGLLTYELTHRDNMYDPAAAAAHATTVADQARAALNVAEDDALRRFVIGMLPQAIGQAWQGMFDWVNQVNTKMRAAAASSGLKVVVRAPKREDLNPAEQTLVELACKMSEADRTDAQTRILGEALRALIDAADGVTMTEKVAAAVDVRQWVNIVYYVDRGNGKEERWGSRTGLSGGERRLVVLAPMLAAVAAGYDALGPTGLRLAALDEVPAEVDERGREGLARYTATLDLDLIATSYLWDGAPGAWDGIEAWDLEAGSDGTVVGFLMSVRGLDPLPGDPANQS